MAFYPVAFFPPEVLFGGVFSAWRFFRGVFSSWRFVPWRFFRVAFYPVAFFPLAFYPVAFLPRGLFSRGLFSSCVLSGYLVITPSALGQLGAAAGQLTYACICSRDILSLSCCYTKLRNQLLASDERQSTCCPTGHRVQWSVCPSRLV